LAVECDGATYHSSATARDRDRLRQEVLESLGWRVCRIWSTDWVRDRDGQVRRVLAAVERAQREGTVPARPPTAPPAPAPTLVAPPPARPQPEPLRYRSIDEVPEVTLREAILGVLRSYGATATEDLVRTVARRLSFQRTGKRIQERVEEVIEALVRKGQVCYT